jgi:hypothetical protein
MAGITWLMMEQRYVFLSTVTPRNIGVPAGLFLLFRNAGTASSKDHIPMRPSNTFFQW